MFYTEGLYKLVDVGRSLLEGLSRHIEKTIDSGLDGIDSLIPQIQWQTLVGNILVDVVLDELLYRSNVPWVAQLSNGGQKMRPSASQRLEDRVDGLHDMLEKD